MKTSRAHFHGFGGILIFCLALSWPSFAEEEPYGLPETAPHQTYKLTLDVESTSGAPLEARVQLYDEVGNSFWPEDPNALIYFGYTAHNYFYADGSVTADVPGGTVILAVSRGLEYASAVDTISVFCDTTLTIVLPELIDLRSQLWYSGDTHVHIDHGGAGDTYDVSPEDLALMGRAEGLGIVCALSNGLHFSGLLHPAGINDHHLYFGMEYRSALFGHMGILGLDTLLNQGCCLPGDPPYPLNYDIGVDAHEQGAVVIAAHPETMDPDEFNNTSAAWPYSGFSRELAADVVLDAVDAIELLSYSNFNNESVIT
ncbi:MAG: hypothetical protein HKN21_09705, partial [Candidatus Eisenbacteria bacterium]|nr:hypothetical protein [Candidatus Eisenbacteria bacterium]